MRAPGQDLTMASTIKPLRKVKGSITGEIWETRAAGIPRRRLPDGRTETGKAIEAEAPPEAAEAEPIIGNIEIEVEDDGLDFKPAGMDIQIAPGAPPKIEAITEKQPPKSSKKDIDKMNDLLLAFSAALDDEKYSGEDKVAIIAKLFADSTDIRVETAQYVMSARTFSLLAVTASTLLLLKSGSGGLLGNYRKMVASMNKQQTKIDDPFGEP